MSSIDLHGLFSSVGPGTSPVGTVSRQPATTADGVYVTTPDAPGVEYGPLPWPRDGAFKPVIGDQVLLLFPSGIESSNPWVVAVRRNG